MMKVSIVEDYSEMRRMIRGLIVGFADEIFECADGGEALAAYKSHHPD